MRISEIIAAIEQADERTFTIIRLAVEERARTLRPAFNPPKVVEEQHRTTEALTDHVKAIVEPRTQRERLVAALFTKDRIAGDAGRPFKIDPKRLAEAFAAIENGQTVKGVAKSLSVSEMSMSRYLKRYRDGIRKSERSQHHPSNR